MSTPKEPTELWLPVPGYEGLYEVSDQGQVRTLPRPKGDGTYRPGFVMTPALNTSGYKVATLSRDGRQGVPLFNGDKTDIVSSTWST
jgi:hypothetical protein